MSDQALTTYLNKDMLPYPFCAGCGHGKILDQLNAALVELQLDPHQVVIVTDIGCGGLSDRFFTTNAFHGLHGRSVTYASGIKLANPDLHTIVLMGDGACGIGGNHLLSAARRNIGITVLVFNNLNYGMTGGEHSVTTPMGAITSTTREGNLERPMDICSTVAINGAGFVARTTTFDKSLPELIGRAINHDGFSLIDIWELCTAHYVPNNRFSRKELEATMARQNMATGILHEDQRPEFARTLQNQSAEKAGHVAMPSVPLETEFSSSLMERRSFVIAGTAGTRVGSAAAALCRAAVLSGLWSTLRHDYPVTVRSGYSVAEAVLSPEEIFFTGVDLPDVIVALTPDGLKKVEPQITRLGPAATVYLHAKLPRIDTQARKVRLDFSQAGKHATKKDQWPIMAVAEVLRDLEILPIDALKRALEMRPSSAEARLDAVESSAGSSRSE
jgi:pyruvate/2-oxoacid:ferredoxin oxidoreductase beta subunit/Pyruvate/2-oxoacid:ferredoxin oxidoreductase gamma subunit